MPEARGSSWEELPLVLGQGQWPGGATLHLRPGVAAGRSHPTSKEQQLCFAGAAMKRYPTPKVRETQDGRCCKRASEGRHTETILTEI